MANAIRFHDLCLWLLLFLTITLKSEAKHIEVPTRLCAMEIEYPATKCAFGSHKIEIDSCESQRVCYRGPDEECRNNDERFQCHPDLRCDSCNICVGCIGKICNDATRALCPSREMQLRRWRKRFGGLFLDSNYNN